MRKTVEEWEIYMKELFDPTDERTEIAKAWFEGFVCGLANAGELSEADEDRLEEFVHEWFN